MTVSHLIGHSNLGIEGEENSWIGTCPWTNEICYGMESGRLYVPHLFGKNRLIDGREENRGFLAANDVINGVAFTHSLVGTSTRSEILIHERPSSSDQSGLITRFRYDGGAHDLLATFDGAFVAPIGSEGLLRMEVFDNQDSRVENLQLTNTDWNCYQVCAIKDGKSELLVAASRRTGLATIQFVNGRGQIPVGRNFAGIDVIGVGHLPSIQWPRAAVGLGTDGTLIFLRDVLDESLAPQVFKLIDVRAYSILVAKGHVFVLSRNALYTFPHLGSQWLDDTVRSAIEVHHIPIRAVDAFLYKENEIFLETVEETISFDVEMLAGTAANPRSSASETMQNGTSHSSPRSLEDHAETLPLNHLPHHLSIYRHDFGSAIVA